jgi:hypothetical protein
VSVIKPFRASAKWTGALALAASTPWIVTRVAHQDPRVSVVVDPVSVLRGQPLTIVGRFHNSSPDSVRIRYPTDCQFYLEILTEAGEVIYPRTVACARIATMIVVPPNGWLSATLRVATGSTPAQERPILWPGHYRAFFIVSDHIRSPGAPFSVR